MAFSEHWGPTQDHWFTETPRKSALLLEKKRGISSYSTLVRLTCFQRSSELGRENVTKLHAVCPEVLGTGKPLFSVLFHISAEPATQFQIRCIIPHPRFTAKTFVNTQLLGANRCDLQVDATA